MKNQKERLSVIAKSLAHNKDLIAELREMILQARREVAHRVNTALVILYWNIGSRIRRDILKEKRAEYGKEIVSSLGRQLSEEFGSGYSEKNLWHMLRFAEVFPKEEIVYALSR